MMGRYIYILLLGTLSISTEAQQLGVLSQQSAEPYLYNAASSGLTNNLQSTAVYRKQWAGLQNSPSTFIIAGHGVAHTSNVTNIFNKQRLKGQVSEKGMFKYADKHTHVLKHAVGGKLLIDKFGAFEHSRFSGSYAIHLPLNTISISLGTSIGLSNYKIDLERVTLLQDNDQTYDLYLTGSGSSTFLNTDLSFLLYGHHFFIGYSSNQFLPNALGIGNNNLEINLNTHHYFIAGCDLEASNDLKLMPNFLLGLYKGIPITTQLLLDTEYKEKYSLGIGCRLGDAIITKVGYHYKQKYSLSYSYDFSISRLTLVNNGSHELLFGMHL